METSRETVSMNTLGIIQDARLLRVCRYVLGIVQVLCQHVWGVGGLSQNADTADAGEGGEGVSGWVEIIKIKSNSVRLD